MKLLLNHAVVLHLVDIITWRCC